MSAHDSHLISLAWNGHPITLRDNGWFDATQAAEKWQKRPIDWLRLEETTAYINAMACALGIQSKVSQPHFGLVTTSRGGKSPGTWMHPKLAVAFARWLDMHFSVWCDVQIDNLLRDKQDWKKLRHMSVASAKLLCETLKDQREADGKETVGYHYKNEHCLVNSLLNGKFAGIDRDKLIGWELDFIGYFDRRDSALIAMGLTYAERKIKLNLEGVDWRKKYQSRLSAPTNDPSLGRLEA